MQTRTEVEKLGERNFRIVAYLDGKQVGRNLIEIDYYDPILEGFNVDTRLSSDLPYNGVARALVERSTEFIQSISRDLKADLFHRAIFTTPEAMERLPHIFEQHGYKIDPRRWKATRVYRPE